MITAVVLTLMALLLIPCGEKILSDELKETENEERCLSGLRIWRIGGFAFFAALFVACLLFRERAAAERFLFLYYILLYGLLIGIVDSFSHNYYLEMLPGLVLFIPAGCFTWGVWDAVCGLLAGICCGSALALAEWLLFRKVSLGGGDAVYGAAASCLAGYSNLLLYWTLFCVIMLIAAAVHVISVKAVQKQPLEKNRFVPLLPWLSALTACFYAVSVFRTI